MWRSVSAGLTITTKVSKELGASSGLLKKTHMPTACFKQAYMIVALDRPKKFYRSEQNAPTHRISTLPLADYRAPLG